MNVKQTLTRREILEGALVPAVVAGISGAGCRSAPENQRLSNGQRVLLREAGPMIPPVPAILLSVRGHADEPDELSVVWTFIVEGDPPQIGISVHRDHRAGALVAEHGEFVLNVPSAQFIDAFDTVDMNSSKLGDKYELSGLTRGTALVVDAPTVVEAPIQCECRVFNRVDVPPNRTLYLAEVVKTTVLPGVCDPAGRLIVQATPFFGMTAGSGEFYTMGERVGNIGATLGRSDIKY